MRVIGRGPLPMACRTCPRWPLWVGRADRVRLHRMVKKARIYSPDDTPPVRLLLVLLANLKPGKIIRSIRDPFYYWSTALGLNILDFLGGCWENDRPLHPVAQAALDRFDVAVCPLRVIRPMRPEHYAWQPSWIRTAPKAVPLREAELGPQDEEVYREAYRQAAYFYSGLLDIVDKDPVGVV